MQKKRNVYIICVLLLIIVNLYYYRQYLLETWMRFKLSTHPVVVTLSTTPHRIADLQPTLETILQQNLTTPIYLSIPHVFKRDNLTYDIPTWLSQNKRITILRTDDYGPATKLLGLLEQVTLDPETIIITLDDDVHYPKNLVLHLAYKALKNPNAAVGIIGANLDYDAPQHIADNSELGLVTIDIADAKVDVLKGYGGVAYRRKFFNNAIFSMTNSDNPCHKADDIIFSYFLATQQINKIVLKNKYSTWEQIRWQTDMQVDSHALQKLIPSPVEKHRICLAYLHTIDPNVEF